MMAHDALSAKLRETTQKLRSVGPIGSEDDSTPDEEEYERELKEMNELVSRHDNMQRQTIELSGDDDAGPTSIFRFEVNIHASHSSSTSREGFSPGSSKVTVGTITSHQFNFKFQYGNLVASTNDYLAYILEGRNGFVVRVVHQSSGARGLLKDFTGAVVDLSFAHAGSNMLACVDQGGNIHVFKVAVEETAVVGDVVLSVQRSNTPDDLRHRLVWCPHVVTGEGEEEECLMLAASHGCEAEVLDLDAILDVYGNRKTMRRSEVATGVKMVKEAHTEKINDLALSPDGNVMATAGADGHVKFWKVDPESGNPASCLQDWTPHDGFPVTRILFCDDHQHSDSSNQTFWRFLISGADRSAELKLWCTVTWQCLQTIKFLPPVNNEHEAPVDLVLNLDLSACYCIAADTRRTVLYVLQLQQDILLGQASFTSVREYVLSQPVVSFVPAGLVLPVEGGAEEELGLGEGPEDPPEPRDKPFDCRKDVVTIRLYCIQTRSVQELSVQYEPHDLLTHLPPQLLQESELDRRYSSLMEGKGESDHDGPSAGSAGDEDRDGEGEGKDPLPPPVDMNPLDPNLMPRPLLCSTADSTSAFSVAGETHTTDTRSGLPTAGETVASQEAREGETVASQEAREGETVDQASLVVPSESSVVSSQSVAPTSSGSLCSDASQLEAPVTGSDVTQLDLMARSLSNIHELLGMPEPDMSSAVSSSQGGGDVELFLSRIASGTPEQPAGEPVGGHTLEDTLVSDGSPTTTQEEAEEVPVITEDDTARRTVVEDQEVSPDTQAEGSHLDRRLGGEPVASSSSVDSSSISNLTPPDLDLDSAESPRFFTSQQVGREKESAVAGMQEVVCSTAEETASPDAQVQADVSEPLPQQTEEPTTSGTAHPMSEPVDASHSPTIVHPSKALPVMKGVKLGVVVKRREEEGPVGSREEDPGGMKEEEGPRESSEKEGSSGSLLEDGNTEQAKEEETPHDGSYREQLMTSREQEGVMMWTQHTTDVKGDPFQTSSVLAHLQEQLTEQRQQIARLREEQQEASETLLDRVQSLLSAQLQQQHQLMDRHTKQQQQQLESLTKEQRGQEKQRIDRLSSALSQAAAGAVQSRLEKVVKAEMKNAIVPVVTRSLNGLADQISSTVSQRLTVVEATTKDAVVKMVKSQMVADSIAGAVVAALQPVLQSTLDKTFKASSGNMVEAFEQACREMCLQINQTFNAGTSQYLSQLHQHLDRHRQGAEGVESVREASMRQLLSTVQGLPVLVGERQAAGMEQLQEAVQREGQQTVQEVSQLLQERLPELVAAQVTKCFEDNVVQVSVDSERSRQQRKSKVDSLLAAENYDGAFNEALAHSDLELVVHLCATVNPDKLFDQPLLSQPVLLSLIQHLAVDLSNSLDLKLQYLESCLMAIDDQDSLVRSHLAEVLGGLTAALKKVEANMAATQPAKARAARKLRMLTERISQ